MLMHPPVQVMGPASGLGCSGDTAGSARGAVLVGPRFVPGGTARCGAVQSGWVGPCVRMRAELPMCRVSSGACGARGFGFPCACGRPPVPGSASRRAPLRSGLRPSGACVDSRLCGSRRRRAELWDFRVVDARPLHAGASRGPAPPPLPLLTAALRAGDKRRPRGAPVSGGWARGARAAPDPAHRGPCSAFP